MRQLRVREHCHGEERCIPGDVLPSKEVALWQAVEDRLGARVQEASACVGKDGCAGLEVLLDSFQTFHGALKVNWYLQTCPNLGFGPRK